MKKYILYLGILIAGIFLGYLFFNNSSSTSEENQKHSATAKNQRWTCSMHPQIMRNEAGDCPICGMELIPANTEENGLSESQFKMTKNAMALANIETTIVGESQSNSASLELSGKITENENETATQPAHFNGRIEKLYVKTLGEKVKMGQAIAKIYSPDIVAAQQELISAYKNKESQPRLYKAVRNKFSNWKISDAQLNIIEKTGNIQNSFTIYAHVSGIVTAIEVNEGSHIMDGKPIFKVANLSSVWTEFDAYENELKQLKEGQSLEITSNAYPNKKFTAKINFVDPVLNTSTRTVTVRAELENKEKLLKPGMFVSATVENNSATKSTNITIFKSAVMWTGKRSLVYVKTNLNEPVFEMRKVILGAEVGDEYVILKGLQKGDVVVTKGAFTVDAAAQLQGKKSMMNAEMNTFNLSEEIEKQFSAVMESYLQLKNNLVNDEAENGRISSEEALKKLNQINSSSTSSEENFKEQLSNIQQGFLAISKTSAIEKQRTVFISLSENMISLVKKMESKNTLYVQKCPMANNNKGATWLSTEKEIRNPYYGKEMLGCGSVINVLE